MGRLDNAMRRAAGDQGATAAVDLPLPSDVTVDELPNEGGPVAPPAAETPAPPARHASEQAKLPAPAALPEPDLQDKAADLAPSNGKESAMLLRTQLNSALATKT